MTVESTTERIKVRLEGVEETLLIPLWARATETKRWDAIVQDPLAVELVDRIDYNFGIFGWGWPTQLVIAIRTEILDRATRAFLARHPDALVVNLAAGLDTRFYRVDNGSVTWVDVDLPRSMDLRRSFFNDTARHHYVTGSVLEDAWLDQVPHTPGQPVLVIAEGLLMYFSEEETRGLVSRIARRFPGAEMLFECIGPEMVDSSSWAFRSANLNARFRGGIRTGAEFENWDARVRFVEQWNYLDQHPLRWGPLVLGRLLPAAREFFKIVHLKVAAS